MVNRKFRNGEIFTAVDAIVFIPYEEVSPVPCNSVAVHSADRFQEPDNFGEKCSASVGIGLSGRLI